MKSLEEHFEDYKLAEAYDYPRGEVTAEGFIKYLKALGELAVKPESQTEVRANTRQMYLTMSDRKTKI